MIFRLGRLLTGGARGPGVFFIIPCVDIYEKIDMRTATYEIPPQEILTKDSVTVFVNAIMYYKVIVFKNLWNFHTKVADATCAVTNVDDYSGSARLLAATTLRNPIVWKILSKKLSSQFSSFQERAGHKEPGRHLVRARVDRSRTPRTSLRGHRALGSSSRES